MSDRLIRWVVDRLPEWLCVWFYWHERRKGLSSRAVRWLGTEEGKDWQRHLYRSRPR